MHRIVVLGAGYAGLPAANRIARQTYRDEVEVVLVSTHDQFVERPRLHQLATGQKWPHLPLARFLAPGVSLRVGTVTRLDRGHRTLTFAGSRTGQLGYDTLVYAPGSTIDLAAVPGVAEYAQSVADPESAERIAATLRDRPTARVVVCGGGLTALELATEVAESYPRAQVSLVTRGRAGGWLSGAAQRQLHRAMSALGVRTIEHTEITGVGPQELRTSDGPGPSFDLCLWAGGFVVPPLAADAGLAVDARGRVITDRTLRSVSDPAVYAIGDAAAVPGPWGTALAMGCRTGAFTGPTAADAIVARLTDRPAPQFRFRYLHECLSLGRRRAVIQFLHRDGTPTEHTLRGRPAIAYKNTVLDSGRWAAGHPGPYRLRPRRHVSDLADREPVPAVVPGRGA
jgi:NADH dehydrogenase FAD-containing subunit